MTSAKPATHPGQANVAEETVEAIHRGDVDALVVDGPGGPQIVMLQNAEQPYRVLVERMSEGALTLGPDDRILYANQRLADMTGRPVESLIGQSFAGLFEEFGTIDAESTTAPARLKSWSASIPVSVWLSALLINGISTKLVTISDVSVHQRVEEIVSAERFSRSILEQSTEAIIVLGFDGRITHASLMAEEIAVRPPVGLLFSQAFAMREQSNLPVPQRLDVMLARKPFHGMEIALLNARKESRAYLVSAGPLQNENKEPIGAIVTLTDITVRKQTEERQRVLVAELNHRVKNILGLVQAISVQTVRTSNSLEAYNSTFAGRVQALSTAHDILTRTRWSGIGIGELLENVLSPYLAPDNPRILLAGPPALLPARTVVPLSMAMHELATNACKYGALSGSRGRVEVNWSVAQRGDPQVHLSWSEHGGPSVAAGAASGFGTKLIKRVVGHDLDGTVDLDFAPGGLQGTLTFPLNSHAELNDLVGGADAS